MHFTLSQFVNVVLSEWPMSDITNYQCSGESNRIESNPESPSSSKQACQKTIEQERSGQRAESGTHNAPQRMTPNDLECSVIFVNENENENGEKRQNNEFVNEN